MSRLIHHGKFVASIGLDDADNLSRVASAFGARSQRDAIRRPGGFGRPVVGSNPEYYSRQAQIVFRKAVKSDPELSGLYLQGRSLNYSLEQSLHSAYRQVGGPSVRDAVQLVSVTEEIQNRLSGLDLRINLSGKWLGRAQDLSRFALRVIGSPEVALEQQRAAEIGKIEGTLYAGLAPDVEVNTAVYWQSVLSQLRPEPGNHTAFIG